MCLDDVFEQVETSAKFLTEMFLIDEAANLV
jgi:hypothetical protein